MKTSRIRKGAVPGLLLLAAGAAAWAGCSSPVEHRVENLNPHVRLTGGPVPGDSVSYTAELFWSGWDDDGIIDHYQYAIDIPDQFTLDQINSAADVGIAWVDTTSFRARFRFTATEQDTVIKSDGTLDFPERYKGVHTFFVRAVDNEGAVSKADFLSFTARTVTPRTTFVTPRVAIEAQILQVGRQLSMSWRGVDPDSPDPRLLPAYYEWKIIVVANPVVLSDANYAVKVLGRLEPWHRVGVDTTFLRIPLDPPQDYVVAVRSIDEAGGVESRFNWGQNAVKVASLEGNRGTPDLRVSEVTLGSVNFPGDGQVTEFEVPVNRCLRFDFVGDAEAYGGVIQGYNYGIDVPDADADGPASGFVGWSLIPYTYTPICFSSPGIHTLTFKCRDTGGGVTIGTMVLRIVSFPGDREVLYVDDFYLNRSGAVTDAMMDERARAMLAASGVDPVFQYDTFGTNDLSSVPETPRLSEMGRYRIIVWSVWGVGFSGNPALVKINACPRNRLLQAYVGTGGAVWVYGQQVFSTFRSPSPDNCLASLAYSRSEGMDFLPGMFPCDFMHICGGDIRDVKDRSDREGLVRVRPSPEAALESFPVMETDSTVFNARGLGGLAYVDAMFSPTFDASGGLDTLYTMVSTRNDKSDANPTSFHKKPVAFRYFDPDPAAQQGPVAVFGFPLHLLKQGSAADRTGVQGMTRSMLDWLRVHTRLGKTPAG